MPQQRGDAPREPLPAGPERRMRGDAARTSPRTAIWNALTALAIIAVLFITFYGINAERSQPEQPTATASTPAPSTTGQGSGSQEGSQSAPAPAGDEKR